ncbi:TonB-dependent receptor [Betaproteobacteria bacterium]|nr:TonB-dependent receptor [Betaproteobacteria bacterium]
MNHTPYRLHPLALAILFACASPVVAADSNVHGEKSTSHIFTLGEITVTAKHENETSPLEPDTLDSEQLNDFSRDGLPESLNLIPGVSSTSGSGSRNETLISVRGFDRWRVPLLLDGIRVYLPADNRLDFDRFLTPDLAEIQVSKGYVSVLNGPDGMGGAINLVTRKPTKPFEGEVRATAAFANNGHYNGNTLYTSLGTRQEQFYFQAGVEQRDMRSFYLSDDFKPTQYENGGRRDHTSKKDWRVNLKAGFTPNATDEYSLNFIKQEGEKHRAFSVHETNQPNQVWDWPTWDVWNLYFLSHTQLGDKRYIKTRVYFNKFDNDLVDSAPSNPANNGWNWTSTYDDSAYGANVELGADLIAGHTIKGALFWRRDNHTEWNHKYPTDPDEPKQDTTEDVFSVALEETWHVTPEFDLVFGLSRDARFTRKAEEYGTPNSYGGAKELFDQPTADTWATNYQGAAIWRYRPSGSAHFSVSNRTRFPTMFERFSSRFGSAASNPTLKPERALNIELGVKDQIVPGIVGSAAIFHNEVDDAIQSVSVVIQGNTYGQSQNVGSAIYKGIELGITASPAEHLEVGANYSYIDTRVHNPNNASERLETTPRHKGFFYAKWQALPRLTIIPALELSDNRWSNTGSNNYVKTGAYELLSVKMEYRLAPQWDVSIAARNLLDKNYATTYGYPQEGRSFLLSTRYQF